METYQKYPKQAKASCREAQGWNSQLYLPARHRQRIPAHSGNSVSCLSHVELSPQHPHMAQTPHKSQGCVKKLHLLPALQDLVSSRYTQDPAVLPPTDPCARAPSWLITLSKVMKRWSHCHPIPCFPAPSFLKNLHPSLGAIPRYLCNPRASQLYNYTQTSNSSSLLPILAVINLMKDSLSLDRDLFSWKNWV